MNLEEKAADIFIEKYSDWSYGVDSVEVKNKCLWVLYTPTGKTSQLPKKIMIEDEIYGTFFVPVHYYCSKRPLNRKIKKVRSKDRIGYL